MYQKIKFYYQNSPKRIGIAWLIIHLLFLGAGIFCLSQGKASMFSVNVLFLSAFMVWLFPFSLFLNLNTFVFPPVMTVALPFIIPVLYYAFFAFLLWKAQNTQSRSFKVALFVFTVYFIVSIISSFYLIFY